MPLHSRDSFDLPASQVPNVKERTTSSEEDAGVVRVGMECRAGERGLLDM